MQNTSVIPTEIRLNPAKDELTIAFDNGETFHLSAEFLRVHSPSAEVQGHSPQEKKTIPGKKDVTIADIIATGNYAIRLVFSDGHDTGLFSWPYLYEIGTNQEALWTQYLEQLAKQGLNRDS